ncbi:hypothetical protein MMC27_001053 [Xylographa pallens]|nr:hypothetical protein [Xylographa pallens]
MREISASKEFNLWCAKQVEKLKSPLCQVFVEPFGKPWVLLADWGESQDIMLRRKDFDRSTFISNRMAAAGSFHATFKTNDAWKATRQWMQDLMTPSFLNKLVGPAAHSKMVELVDLWENKALLADGRPFEAAADLNHAALDVMLVFSFGKYLGHSAIGPQRELIAQLDPSKVEVGHRNEPVSFPEAPVDEFLVAAHQATEIIEKVTNSMAPKFSLWWLRYTSWYKTTWGTADRVVRQHIHTAVHRLREGKVQTAIDHMMMREEKLAEKMGRLPDFENQVLVDEHFDNQIFGELIAGHHTTGAALSWILKFLTENPLIQSKLRSALHSACTAADKDNRFPSFAELNRATIPYLEAVIEEALRLHSTTVTREAMCDTEILGHRIPKGTTVFLVSNGPGFYSPSFSIDDAKRSPTSRAAKPRSWDETKDMKVFDPERWLVQKGLDEVEFDGAAGPQLIFGLGTRGCFGRRLAYIGMRLMTALVVWNFDLLETPESLSSHAAEDGISHRARQCFVRLKSLKE